uniref:Uncharacterized protein n=1 Tax=Anguilla anguilla TaxID=7936 RepID=A0A0E9PCA0_ANGAN
MFNLRLFEMRSRARRDTV